MILSEKYKEIMDQVRVTDEMKQRVLRNMKEQVEAEKASKLRMNVGNKVRTIRKQKSGERPESGKIIQSRFSVLWPDFQVSFRCSLYHDAACGRIDCAAAAASGKWTSAGSHGHGSRDGTGRDHGGL